MSIMLFTWLIFLHLLKFGYFNDETIEKCFKEVGENEKKKRPTVEPDYCHDTNPDFCNAFFGKQGPTYLLNLNPTRDYQVNEKCNEEKYETLSITKCASSCAKCCLTKQFNCKNDAASNEICQQLNFPRHCKNPILYPMLVARCPATCGLCDQPGALGECPDRSDICATIIGLDRSQCNKTSVANMCMKSCNLKTCLPNSKTRTTCDDKRQNCYSYQPFCNIPRYADFLKRECCRTCSAPICTDSRYNCPSYKPFCSTPQYADFLRRQCCRTCSTP